MASTTNSGLESKAESSIRVRKKYGHLQLCILDVLSSIGNGVWDPQGLGNHGSEIQNTTVEHPRVLNGRAGDERAAVWSKAIGGRDDFAL